MSLIRQIWLLIFTVLALAVGGAVLVNLKSARDTLQAQVNLKNADNAQTLALALSQQRGDRGHDLLQQRIEVVQPRDRQRPGQRLRRQAGV